MKPTRIIAIMASVGLLAACSMFTPSDDAYEPETRRISREYFAIGEDSTLDRITVFEYGTAIVLKVSGNPSLSILDEAEKNIEYEKMDGFYRIPFYPDHFTVIVDGKKVYLRSVRSEKSQTIVFSASTARTRLSSNPAADSTVSTGRIFRAARENQDASMTKLVTVSFAPYSTKFQPSKEDMNKIVRFSKTTDQVTVRGYTDSAVAGSLDPKIARDRALSAKATLLKQGVPENRISLSSQAAGGFIANNKTREGRNRNRRVEISFSFRPQATEMNLAD